jgi:hypothetical protein
MENKTKQVPITQRSLQKTYFDHKDMDSYFSWIVGRHVFGGSQKEECFDATSRILDGDPHSWHQEWAKLARRVEDQAKIALQVGAILNARDAYLRACTYYRAPLFIMNPKDSTFHEYFHKMQYCFQQAVDLFTLPVE